MKKTVNKLQLNKIQVTRLQNLATIKGGSYDQYTHYVYGDDDDDDTIRTQTSTHRFK